MRIERTEEQALFIDNHNVYLKMHDGLLNISDTDIISAQASINTYAQFLVHKYIKSGSQCELNLSRECRQDVMQQYELEKDNTSKNLFERVVSHILVQIHNVYDERFVRSEIFELFLTKLVLRRAQIEATHHEYKPEEPLSVTQKFNRNMRRRFSGIFTPVPVTVQQPLREDLYDMREVVKGLFEEVTKKDAIILDLRQQLEKEKTMNEMSGKIVAGELKNVKYI